MRWWIALLLGAGLGAQDPAPVGVIRGDLLGWKGGPTAGQFSILTTDRHIYQYSFDSLTYFERGSAHILISDTRTGDRLEVIGDRGSSPSLGYARSVQIMPRPKAPAPRGHIEWHNADPTESIVPRGDVTLAGVVVRLVPGQIVLRTRGGTEKSVLLRADTLFLEAGSVVNAGHLQINQRIFIRAGNNLYDQLEAFQVIWGQILTVPDE